MKDIKLIYHSNYWDGPLSGACLHDNKRYWFSCVHDYWSNTESGKPLNQRIYAIHSLTDEEWADENKWHQLFTKYVGDHTEYDDEGCRKGSVRQDTDHQEYYRQSAEAKEKDTRLKKELGKPIGYFDSFEKKFRSTKYRDYWCHQESPISAHNRGCEDWEFVEFREDAHYLDDKTIEWVTGSSWAICMADEDEPGSMPKWWRVRFCSWCGSELEKSPPTG